MTNQENILIDTIVFNPPLPMEHDKVIWMFSSYHDQDCCEWHEIDFSDSKTMFDTAKDFLNQVDKIEIKWTIGAWITLRMADWNKEYAIFFPWRWSNNWYYGSNIDLIVRLPDWSTKEYDVSAYQDIE